MTKTYRFHASLAAKTIAAILPAVQMILLRFSAVQSSTVAFMIVADGISEPPFFPLLCFFNF